MNYSKKEILATATTCLFFAVIIAGIFYSMGHTDGLQEGIDIGRELGIDIGKLELLKEQREAAAERQRIVEVVQEVLNK